MLLELAAANAAFAVVKEALSNGSEIAACGAKLGEYFGLKAEIAKKASSKGSDSEEFWALEALRESEAELKTILIYSGRAGLYDDFLAHQAKKKRERDQAERDKALEIYKRKQLIWAWINGVLIVISVLTGLVFIAGLVWVIVKRGTF
tara:strand:- start:215 stop:658 length:444 start_codon:yes stop_codon:yes gene_type:complete